MIRAVAFDLDGTLAESKSAISGDMARVLKTLLFDYDVCIITGGGFPQIQSQVLANLQAGTDLSRIHVLPTCGAAYHRWSEGGWATVHQHVLTQPEAYEAAQVIEDAARGLGFWESNYWGDRIENRGTQVTFSALGQQAPLELKRAWDPEGVKKVRLQREVQLRLPHLEVRAGGTTSIDVTSKGMDKRYGIDLFMRTLSIHPTDLIFFGDHLEPGGNDHPVTQTGTRCIQVTGPDETLRRLTSMALVKSAARRSTRT